MSSRHGALWIVLVAVFHLVAIAIMAWSEVAIVPKVAFVLSLLKTPKAKKSWSFSGIQSFE